VLQRSATTPWPRRTRPALCALLAAGALLLAAGGANASCGDYVHVTGRARAARPYAPDEPRQAPCRGPHCERGREHLPAAPTVLPAPAGERWGNLAGPFAFPPAYGVALWPDAEEARRVHRCFPPEPPPRPTSAAAC
jgi:hypothetical protein